MSSKFDHIRFLIGFSEDLEEECRATILHDNIDLSKLMVHVQQVKDNRMRKRAHEVRRPKPFYKAGPSSCGVRSTFRVRD